MKTIPLILIALGAPMTGPATARAADNSAEKPLSPYIEQLRREIEAPKSSDSSEDYTHRMQERLLRSPEDSSSYTEDLRRQLKEAEDPSLSYTQKQRREIEAAQAENPELERDASAIRNLQEGHSELHAKMKGEIHHAAGLRYGLSLVREIASATQLRDFASIYGGNYAPDVTLFYEYQPFHSEWFGNIGLMGSFGASFFHGSGVFQFQLAKPSQMGAGFFSSTSKTQFQFLTFPLALGVNYRFNLLRILRPYVAAGPALIGYLEMRNDDGATRYGESRGLFLAGGVSILLDWISRGSSWDLYAEHGIKHYYLTIDYTRLSIFSGDLTATVSGVNAGLTFEF